MSEEIIRLSGTSGLVQITEVVSAANDTCATSVRVVLVASISERAWRSAKKPLTVAKVGSMKPATGSLVVTGWATVRLTQALSRLEICELNAISFGGRPIDGALVMRDLKSCPVRTHTSQYRDRNTYRRCLECPRRVYSRSGMPQQG